MFEQIVILAVVAGAVALLARMAWRTWKGGPSCACGSDPARCAGGGQADAVCGMAKREQPPCCPGSGPDTLER